MSLFIHMEMYHTIQKDFECVFVVIFSVDFQISLALVLSFIRKISKYTIPQFHDCRCLAGYVFAKMHK